MLVLAMIWWAWVCYVFLTSLVEPEEGFVRILMLAATASLLVVGLCVPQAFGDRALTFHRCSFNGTTMRGHDLPRDEESKA